SENTPHPALFEPDLGGHHLQKAARHIVTDSSGSLESGAYAHAGKGRFAVLFERAIGSYRNGYSEGTDSTRPELSLLPVRPRAFSGFNHHDSEGAWCVAESHYTRIVRIIAVKLKRLLFFPVVPFALLFRR